MKILHIQPFYPSSVYKINRGSFRYEQDDQLAKRGHELIVLSCKTFGAPLFEKIGKIQVFRVPAITIPIIEYPIVNLLMLYSWMAKIVRIKKVDVIHFTNVEYLTSILVLMIRRFLRIPVVLTVIGFPGFSWFYGNFFVDLVGKAYMFTIGKTILVNVDQVILQASNLIPYAVSLGVPINKIKILLRGVNTQRFRPDRAAGEQIRREYNINLNDTVILFAGRLVPVKGPTIFIKAAKKLLARYRDVKFLVAGEGPLRGLCERLTYPYRRNFLFLGYRRDMPKIINAADIIALSSISEGCPNILLEAGACAKAVVSSNVGASCDIVDNGKTGLLFEKGSVDGLVHNLEDVLARSSITEMGRNNMRRVKKYFNWDVIASRCEKIYMETLGLRK